MKRKSHLWDYVAEYIEFKAILSFSHISCHSVSDENDKKNIW